MKKFLALLLTGILIFLVLSSLAENAGEEKTLRIIATSDLHGKFMPWDYARNAESKSGSMTQLATAVAAYRTDATLLVDAGDTIQDNSADIFIGTGQIHPMVRALNAMKYDLYVTGNHDYNYGMDVLKETIGSMDAKVLTGNVYDGEGRPVADRYHIFDVDGVRVAVIGMVTPIVNRWDADNLIDSLVTDPLTETRAVIEEIRGRYDVLVGVFHMGIDNDYGVPASGVTDILNACPEFDVMVSSHEHSLIPGMEINGVLVVQNKDQAQTMSVIDLNLVRDGDGWKVAGKSSESVMIADYEPDPALTELLTPYHDFAIAYAGQVIGRLEGGPLAPENEIPLVPSAQLGDTALIDLINRVQMYYSGARVSVTPLFIREANMVPGPVRICDLSLIYPYSNTLYRLRMNGAQLKKFMEWSAVYYNTWKPGDLTVSFSPDIRLYFYDIFDGVNYEINVAKEPGSRIENLTWPDGTPVKDEEEFTIAVNNHRVNTHLLVPGVVYSEVEEMPVLEEVDIRRELGSIRELIGDYIVYVKGGVITPEYDDNWRITGNDWNQALHEKAVRLLKEGKLELPFSEDGRTPNVRSITEEEVNAFPD